MEAPFSLEIVDVNHVPIVRKFIARLGIADAVNKLVSGRMTADIGQAVVFLILDALSGRSPLYRVAERYSSLDTEALMGNDFDANTLCNHTLGRVLDKLHEAGTQKILSSISHYAIAEFGLDARAAHFDTTSVSLFGSEYSKPQEGATTPHITHGYSKDHRPDLKQFMVSLLCISGNIPVLGRVENGNASDVKLNNRVLTDVSSYLAVHGFNEKATIYIADSAMVSEDNLSATGSMPFLTRLPARYKECGRVIEEAVAKGDGAWTPIGRLSQEPGTPKRPATVYACQEASVTLYKKTYRAVVIHSSAHDKRRQGKVDRDIKKDRSAVDKHCKEITTISYRCEADAVEAARRVEKASTTLHEIRASVKEVPRYGRGRPAKGTGRTPLHMEYQVEVEVAQNDVAVAKLREEAGCLVLLTNLDSEKDRQSYDGKALLSLYKEQYGIEQNFGFLKDPAIVDGIFLKRPERIEVLGLILILALMIWRLMEREMRQYVAISGHELPGWPNRMTSKPTSFMMTTKFHSIRLVRHDGKLLLAQPFNDVQTAYLIALGVRPEEFLPPGLEATENG